MGRWRRRVFLGPSQQQCFVDTFRNSYIPSMLIGPWASEFIETPVDIRKRSLHLKFIRPVPVRAGLKSLKWIYLSILLWQMPISTRELAIDNIFKKSSLRTRETDSASIVRQSPRDSSKPKDSKKGSLLFWGNKESRKFLSIKMK